VRILEVVLPASDPEALALFHAQFAVSTRVRFRAGPDDCSHWALNVAPERFEEAVAFAGQRVAMLHRDVSFEAWRARSAYFFDPAGNIVELIARERAPGDEMFLEVSEVGLPVDDVSVAVDFLESELGLPYFSGDRRKFAAVGDDRGLFIVVPVGRPWLFTDRPAPDAPIEVTIAAARGDEVRVPGSAHTLRLASG
jgi:catechol 2,3-dioxygenase-like lactoylglutathione lyase family enzyme